MRKIIYKMTTNYFRNKRHDQKNYFENYNILLSLAF